MKQTFTLFTAFACSILSTFGQTTETFETNNLASLQTNCWQFTAMGLSSNSVANDVNSVYNTMTDNRSALVTTPFINLSTGTVLSFNYKLAIAAGAKLAGKRYINVSLVDYNGVVTPIGTQVQFDNKSTGDILSFSYTYSAAISSVQKLRIEITSGMESETDVHIDNISIGTATFNTSGVYSCNPSTIILPIKLKSFQGFVADDKTQLSWAVTDNEAGSHFEVEKSADGKDFKTIAVVNTTNATGDASYTYKDEVKGSAYYRLKIVNNSKSVYYSNILFIKNSQGVATNNSISLLQNPVQSALKFSFVSECNANTEIAVYNMTGVKVFQSSFHALKGINSIATTLDGSIKGGTYVLEVKNTTNRSVAKFVKQ